ncbi:hypothetical protein ACP70R_003174 [Stipagrostis hirtigluma subsp. patula]
MGPSLPPSSTAVLSTTADEQQFQCASDDDYNEDDDFEFRPLLPRRRQRGARTGRPRTAGRRVAGHACTVTEPAPSPRLRARRVAPSVAATAGAALPARKVRWHDMAFGSVRVPAAMDMGEIRRRLQARREMAAEAGNEAPPATATAGWAPWRLIRSLSCKGVEAVAVAAAAAPVRLV